MRQKTIKTKTCHKKYKIICHFTKAASTPLWLENIVEKASFRLGVTEWVTEQQIAKITWCNKKTLLQPRKVKQKQANISIYILSLSN